MVPLATLATLAPQAARSSAFDGPSNGARQVRQVMLRRPRTALQAPHTARVSGSGGFFRFDAPIDTVEQLRK